MASSRLFSPWLLAMAALVLLVAGWLMASFPLLIFIGLAPLFSILDSAAAGKRSAWNYIELILLALTGMYLAAAKFAPEQVIMVLLQAISLGLVFAAYAFSRIHLGHRLGKWILLLYWLAAEFVFLQVAPDRFIYLADALALKGSWVRWNSSTGYLGSTLWILLCNLLLYLAVLKGRKVQWLPLIFFLLAMLVPFWYAYHSTDFAIGRAEMIDLYHGHTQDLEPQYVARGEYVARTATWISVLILVFSFVRRKTQEK